MLLDTLAGSGAHGSVDGQGTAASFFYAPGVAVAPSGLLLIDLWRVVDSAASKLASRYVGVGAGQGPTGPEKDGNS